MIILIYDSVYGNTAKIAHVIAEAARSIDNDTIEVVTSEVDFDKLALAKGIIIGSPTQKFNATKPVLDLLEKLKREDIENKKIAVFDTRTTLDSIKGSFWRWVVKTGGYADSRIVKRLHRKGGTGIISEGFYVTDTKGPLKDGEIERAAEWMKLVLMSWNMKPEKEHAN